MLALPNICKKQSENVLGSLEKKNNNTKPTPTVNSINCKDNGYFVGFKNDISVSNEES